MSFEWLQTVAAVIAGNAVFAASLYAIIRIDRHERAHGNDDKIPAWPYFVAAIAPASFAAILFFS